MKVVRGDLVMLALDGRFEVIIHGCNCQCAMGAGIAKTIKQAFPEAYDADKATAKGSRRKLGSMSTVTDRAWRPQDHHRQRLYPVPLARVGGVGGLCRPAFGYAAGEGDVSRQQDRLPDDWRGSCQGRLEHHRLNN